MSTESEARTKAITLILILMVIGFSILIGIHRNSQTGELTINTALLLTGLSIAILVHIAQSLYLMALRSSPRIRMCIKCGRNIPFDAVICPYCRHDYENVQEDENTR